MKVSTKNARRMAVLAAAMALTAVAGPAAMADEHDQITTTRPLSDAEWRPEASGAGILSTRPLSDASWRPAHAGEITTTRPLSDASWRPEVQPAPLGGVQAPVDTSYPVALIASIAAMGALGAAAVGLAYRRRRRASMAF